MSHQLPALTTHITIIIIRISIIIIIIIIIIFTAVVATMVIIITKWTGWIMVATNIRSIFFFHSSPRHVSDILLSGILYSTSW